MGCRYFADGKAMRRRPFSHISKSYEKPSGDGVEIREPKEEDQQGAAAVLSIGGREARVSRSAGGSVSWCDHFGRSACRQFRGIAEDWKPPIIQLRNNVPFHVPFHGKAILASFPDEKVSEIIGRKNLERFTDFTIQSYEQLLNDLKKTRARGFAIDDRELFSDISCIAAPVLRSAGEAEAAISIVSHSSRMNANRIEQLGVLLQEAVLNLSRRLGYEGHKLFGN